MRRSVYRTPGRLGLIAVLVTLGVVACDDSSPPTTTPTVAPPMPTSTVEMVTTSEPEATTTSTQRVSTTPIEGVVSDVLEEWMAEIQDLRASAGPGRIAGFVLLGGNASTGVPSSEVQPVCVGAADHADVFPGALVVVQDSDGRQTAEAQLRGSAFDGHIGCSLWFGVDVPVEFETYVIVVAGHRSAEIDPSVLEEVGWLVHLWADFDSMQANCSGLTGEDPMTCILLP